MSSQATPWIYPCWNFLYNFMVPHLNSHIHLYGFSCCSLGKHVQSYIWMDIDVYSLKKLQSVTSHFLYMPRIQTLKQCPKISCLFLVHPFNILFAVDILENTVQIENLFFLSIKTNTYYPWVQIILLLPIDW